MESVVAEKRESPESASEFSDDGVSSVDETTERPSGDAHAGLAMDEVVQEGISPEIESQVGALRQENQELRDSYLRLRADFENYRKRLDREKGEFYRYALSGAISEIIPVLDNFERALASADEPDSEFARGIDLIRRQLTDVLQKLGLQEVPALQQEFDPKVHEAVVRDDNDEVPNNTVTEVLQKGYRFQERLLRPAMVKVSVGGAERGAEGGENDSGRLDSDRADGGTGEGAES